MKKLIATFTISTGLALASTGPVSRYPTNPTIDPVISIDPGGDAVIPFLIWLMLQLSMA